MPGIRKTLRLELDSFSADSRKLLWAYLGASMRWNAETLEEFYRVDQVRILLNAAQLVFPVWPVPTESRNELTVTHDEPIVIIENAQYLSKRGRHPAVCPEQRTANNLYKALCFG
jgi:hypothetical protein